MHAASLMGFDQVVSVLLESKADQDAQDIEGYPKFVLQFAVNIDTWFQVFIFDWHTYTSLHYAVREGREGVVKQLIRAGADLNIKVAQRKVLMRRRNNNSLCRRMAN